MKSSSFGVIVGLALCGPAWAADFGVMETAEPIEPRAFKVTGFPLLTDRGSADGERAVAVAFGYGLPFNLDVEGQLARDGIATYYGSDVEWNAWTWNRMRISIGSGVHTADFDGGGSANGLDTTAIFTYSPMRRLELYSALDASYEDVDGGTDAALPQRWRFDNEYETLYFTPGVEYALTRSIDLLGEVGVGLNGASDDYASAGVSWYFR